VPSESATIIAGVDTHKHTHYAAVIDEHGRLLGHQQFPASDPGYQLNHSGESEGTGLEPLGLERPGHTPGLCGTRRTSSGPAVAPGRRRDA